MLKRKPRVPRERNTELPEEIKSEVHKIADERLERYERGEITLNEALGISDDGLEIIYGEAYRLYNHGLYEKALQLFLMLDYMKNDNPVYIFAIAACYQQLKDYDTAFILYSRVAMMEETPLPFFYMYECCMKQEQYPIAQKSLELVIERARKDNKFPKMAEKAELMLQKHIEAFGNKSIAEYQKEIDDWFLAKEEKSAVVEGEKSV